MLEEAGEDRMKKTRKWGGRGVFYFSMGGVRSLSDTLGFGLLSGCHGIGEFR